MLRDVAEGRVGIRRGGDDRLVRRPLGGRRERRLDLVMPGPHGPWGGTGHRRPERRGQRGHDRRQGAAVPAPGRPGRRPRRLRAGRAADAWSAAEIGAELRRPRPPVSCCRATRTPRCRWTRPRCAGWRCSARTPRTRARSAVAARPCFLRTPSRPWTACAPPSATACSSGTRTAAGSATGCRRRRWSCCGRPTVTGPARRCGSSPPTTVLAAEQREAASFTWLAAYTPGAPPRSPPWRCGPGSGADVPAPTGSAVPAWAVPAHLDREAFLETLVARDRAPTSSRLMMPPPQPGRSSWQPARSRVRAATTRMPAGHSATRRSPRCISSSSSTVHTVTEERTGPGGRARRGGRRGRGRRRHHRGGGERGLRPGQPGPARAAGRPGTPGGRRESPYRRGGQLRAPVLLPWAEQVPAVLVSWFPGQEFGNALADVLLGHTEPGGRLPVTWPADRATAQHPARRRRAGVRRRVVHRLSRLRP